MESKQNRNRWILVIAVAAAAILLCCCLAAAAAALLVLPARTGWDLYSGGRSDTGSWGAPQVEGIVGTYAAGAAPHVEITNFAGKVTVRTGAQRTIEMVATKHAPTAASLNRIQVNAYERNGGLVITTQKLGDLTNARVDLEITAPADTSLMLRTGAGDLEIRDLAGQVEVWTGAGTIRIHDVSGSIQVETGAGQVEVRGATGEVRLQSGVGEINYEGTPAGACSFGTGAGAIKLRMPADLQARVDLETSMGRVEVDFAVDGQVTQRRVEGVIGGSGAVQITARTGIGEIELRRRRPAESTPGKGQETMEKADRNALIALPIIVLIGLAVAWAGSQGGASALGLPVFASR
jgi:hypothetical protein